MIINIVLIIIENNAIQMCITFQTTVIFFMLVKLTILTIKRNRKLLYLLKNEENKVHSFSIQGYEGYKWDTNLIILYNHFSQPSPLPISWKLPILAAKFSMGRSEMPLVVLDDKLQL